MWLTIGGCAKVPQPPSMNCPAFKRGMLERHVETVNMEIAKLTEDLFPMPIAGDSIGHLKNISTLTERMNMSCNFSARGICYRCLPGNPPLSEIEVTFKEPTDTIIMYCALGMDSTNRLSVVSVYE